MLTAPSSWEFQGVRSDPTRTAETPHPCFRPQQRREVGVSFTVWLSPTRPVAVETSTSSGPTSAELRSTWAGFDSTCFVAIPRCESEWSAELDVAMLSGRLSELLAPVGIASVSITLGLPLDNLGTPVGGEPPSLTTYELLGDGDTLLRMSQRRDGKLRVDRMASDHSVFQGSAKSNCTDWHHNF